MRKLCLLLRTPPSREASVYAVFEKIRAATIHNRELCISSRCGRWWPAGEFTVSAAYRSSRRGCAGGANGWSTTDCRLSRTRPASFAIDDLLNDCCSDHRIDATDPDWSLSPRGCATRVRRPMPDARCNEQAPRRQSSRIRQALRARASCGVSKRTGVSGAPARSARAN